MTILRSAARVALAGAALFAGGCDAVFYVPGVQPQNFQRGDDVPLKVNALTSVHTQIPKDYYRLPYCQPDGGPKMASENLGEFLTGNKIQSSPYLINMLEEVFCNKVCQVKLTSIEAAKFKLHIKYGYHNNWIIDNLPSANLAVSNGKQQKHYAGGFPIGIMSNDKTNAYIYNHVNINIDYHRREEGYRVVGFAVEPLSVAHKFSGDYEWDGLSLEGAQKPLSTCPASGQHMNRDQIESLQIAAPSENIIFTYDVMWKESEVAWTSRWDVYLTEDNLVPAQVHWYSITNSILVVVFLSLLVISILVRNLRRDIAAYNSLSVLSEEDVEEVEDEKGWKLVHADVFRPPTTMPMLYCVLVGTGVQLGLALFCAIVFSAVGFLSPARRGSLMNASLAFYMICSVFSGYISSRLYKAFRGRLWQVCTILTATLFPGCAFGMFLFFNIILAFMHSVASAPFLDVVIVAAMWCCVSIPLTFLGAYFGYKADAMEFPTVTSTIARAIPPPSPLLNPMIGMTLTGIIPFAAAYVELFFIMTSLWMDQFYYVFGFTLIVYIILIVTCAEVTVLSVYYQLCAENHRWWWYAFFCSGSTAFYMFGYSVIWFRTLEASKMVMTYLLYFGYMSLLSFSMLLVFGSIGSLTSLFFIHKIFSTIKGTSQQ
jgi:transmembrane 9 superfamily member 2/4